MFHKGNSITVFTSVVKSADTKNALLLNCGYCIYLFTHVHTLTQNVLTPWDNACLSDNLCLVLLCEYFKDRNKCAPINAYVYIILKTYMISSILDASPNNWMTVVVEKAAYQILQPLWDQVKLNAADTQFALIHIMNEKCVCVSPASELCPYNSASRKSYFIRNQEISMWVVKQNTALKFR